MKLRRRDFLASAALLIGTAAARAATISGALPWSPNAGNPPDIVRPGPWQFFSSQEAAAIEAIADRIIPADPQTPGGKDAGCAVFLDRQLAGPYGRREGLYVGAPFVKGSKQQGPQSADSPAQLYRRSLADLDRYCRANHGNRAFAELSDSEKDEILSGMESARIKLETVDASGFFETLLKDIQEGFFADPLYGGNRDMAAWKMIGFPGARYDYRDWVSRHNERYPLPPVSILGRPEWTPAGRT
jgi:gluconate 2-dehydrogenase gamma chain